LYTSAEYWFHYLKWILRGSKGIANKPRPEQKTYPRFRKVFYAKPVFLRKAQFQRAIQFHPSPSPQLSIIVYAGAKKAPLLECLNAISSTVNGYIPYEVIVVLDIFPKSSPVAKDSIAGIRSIKNEAPRGRAQSYNRAVREAHGTDILFLDSHIMVSSSWLQPLWEELHGTTFVGACGPLVLAQDGSVHEAGRFVTHTFHFERIDQGAHPESYSFTAPSQVDYCSADCLLTRKDIFTSLGGFFEDFKGEQYLDLDYGLKLRAQGYASIMAPASRVLRLKPKLRDAKISRRWQNLDHRKVLDTWEPRKEIFRVASPHCLITNFKAIEPLEIAPGSIAIHAHIFYTDLADEIRGYLANIPWPFDLFISVVSEDAREACLKIFSPLPQARKVDIRVVPNKGWDIAPLLCTFAQDLTNYDFFAHIHSKKSSHSWRKYLFDGLFLDENYIKKIFAIFHYNYKIGMFYPAAYSELQWRWNSWGGNWKFGKELARRLGLESAEKAIIEFPAGAMFWAKSVALQSLFDLGLQYDDFDSTDGSKRDGTLAHAIERIFVLVIRRAGFDVAIGPSSNIKPVDTKKQEVISS
jgi:GT2 family glycosyltransferase